MHEGNDGASRATKISTRGSNMCDHLEGLKGFFHEDPTCVITSKGGKDSFMRIQDI